MTENLTAKFTALEAQLSSEHTAVMDALSELSAQIGAVATNTDLALVNGAVNTRALLQALGANSPCGCSTPPTLLVPPIGTTPIGIGSDQCKRIQAFLHTVQEIVTTLDAVSSFSISLDFTLLNNSINEVVTSIESGSGLPVISFPEGVQLVGDTITYVADNLLVGGSLSAYFASVLLDLRSGMALGTSADSMQSLYNGVIDASALPSYVKPVIRDAAYCSLYSFYFDPGTTPALGGYDGSACGGTLHGITSCQIFTSTSIALDGATFQYLDLPVATSTPVWGIEGDFFGWTLEILEQVGAHNTRFFGVDSDGTLHLHHNLAHDEGIYDVVDHNFGIAIISTYDGTSADWAFTIKICPPS
jgi:hypothetical protein